MPVHPSVVKKYASKGWDVLIDNTLLTDWPSAELGDVFVDTTQVIQQSDILAAYAPDEDWVQQLPSNKVLVSLLAPFQDRTWTNQLLDRGVQPFSLDMIPRTSRAQSMDVLSSMASIAGYKAVLLGAAHLPKYFPMMITAAGSVRPSKVLVIGAGVAGLQAIATARRLGAVVEAFDTRAAVKEEVQSLGAKFVEVEGAKDEASAGGYAVEQSEDYKQRQQALVKEKAAEADVVITTAQVRGRKAPLILPKATVESMKPGSVIVDLAASTGGNCEVTQDNATINHQGVTVIGDSNLANSVPIVASELFANNVFNFVQLFINEEGQFHIDFDDDIIAASLLKPE
ncbi:MAG: NAD(P) transhydrogenase subunit alpha [Saprospiraceae bacterium]|nr:NAD(P) transhydrogenase subunit alpha [Saprospiraceae bacterium]